MNVSVVEIGIISFVGILMGAMGAIIGSTLLVLVPMLSFMGLPIQTAIGTAKISVVGREVVPAIYFHRHKLVTFKLTVPFSAAAIIASYLGSIIAVSLQAHLLEKIVAVCMISISLIILFNPSVGLKEKDTKRTLVQASVSALLGAFVGIYAGIFGGGANVFIIFGFIFIFGNTFLQATANSKLPNLLITASSLPMFMINDFVSWPIAIPLTISTAIGSYFGAKLAIDQGNKFIRSLFVGLVIVLAFRYLI